MNPDSISLQKKTSSYAALFLISFFISIFIMGCLENYGRLKRSTDVKKMFETGQLPSEYNYYFHGRRSQPYAVMGLEPDWTLRSKIWRKVELNTEEFKHMTKWIWEDVGYDRQGKYGAQILDPEFVKIGIMYTAVWFATIKVDPATKTVEVMPQLWQGEP